MSSGTAGSPKSNSNRLIREKSPYLLQHSNNPVDWYPWGDEAFETAKRLDCPVLLSIGYATCHWCHVMERESFEDKETAELMNNSLVSVKVDREERPDIDGIYMTVCQMMTGAGGWPLTIIMTPDKEPFFAATYIPKTSAYGRVGMQELIPRVSRMWKENRTELTRFASDMTAALRRQETAPSERSMPDETLLRAGLDQLIERYDPEHGGFGAVPKFPTPQNILFLLRASLRFGDPKAREMAEHTLSVMRCGGIWDHVGFGFHRYSTDQKWLVPHFEKMLYDQALLAIAYLEAYQLTCNPLFSRTCCEILDYVLRDMTAPEGGFHSAEDADSEGEEGKFYMWSSSEIEQVLGKEAAWFCSSFNVKAGGNFSDPAGSADSVNILHLSGSSAMADVALDSKLSASLSKLRAAREQRIRPLKDDKILADWNGLMISAFSRAAQAFNDPRYLNAARNAAGFVLREMRDTDKSLLHRYRDKEAAISGNADDYVFFIAGLLDLYETDFDKQWLSEALKLNRIFLDRFEDREAGGFFFTSDSAEALLVRKKEIYDGAIPSSNSVALMNLVRLVSLTQDDELRQTAIRAAEAFFSQVKEYASAFGYYLCAVDFLLGPSASVTVAGKPGSPDAETLLRTIRDAYLPHKTVAFSAEDRSAEVRICRDFTCLPPETDPARILDLMGRTEATR